MFGVDAYLVVAKAVTLAAGGFVTVLAARAYRRTGSPALRALSVGLGLVAVGTLLAGAVHQLTGFGILAGVAVQSTFTAAGFLVLAYSLYAGDGSGRSGRGDPRRDPPETGLGGGTDPQ